MRVDPSLFYTGLIADLYAPLRSESPDPEPYARFIAASGEPALELACGDGDPILELRRRGLDVEGLDASPDMLERCRRAAAEHGVDVVLHHQTMENVLGRPRGLTRPDGSVLRVTPLSQAHDEIGRTQTTVMRYEIVEGGTTQVLERPWLLHWHTQAGFRELAASAGLETNAVLDTTGAPATESADVFVFWLVATP